MRGVCAVLLCFHIRQDIRAIYTVCQLAGVAPGTAVLVISGDSKPHAWWPHAALPPVRTITEHLLYLQLPW